MSVPMSFVNRSRGPVGIYIANPGFQNSGFQSASRAAALFTMLTGDPEHEYVEAGDSISTADFGSPMPVNIGTQQFEFVFGRGDGDENPRISYQVDSHLGARDINIEFRDNEIFVADSVAGDQTIRGGHAGASGGEDHEGDPVTVGPLLSWSTPTAEDSRRLCTERIGTLTLPVENQAEWEKSLQKLTEDQSRSSQVLRSQADKATIQAVSDTPCYLLYRLQLECVRTAVLATSESDRDAQVVYDRPNYKAKKLGREERGVVEVEEQRNGWIRYRPQPGDTAQCWVAMKGKNGRWEVAPEQSAASLQTEFFVESSLELLLFSLRRDVDAADVLLKCIRRFAGRLTPLSLFESAGTIIEVALEALIDWLTERVRAQTTAHDAAAGSALAILIQLAVARGTLPAVLRLAEFLVARPHLLSAELLPEIEKLANPDCFERAARAKFSPEPGSQQELVEDWEDQVLSNVALAAESDACDQIREAVQSGDATGAESILRAKLTKKAFATIAIPHRRVQAQTTKALKFREVFTLAVEMRKQVRALGCITTVSETVVLG